MRVEGDVGVDTVIWLTGSDESAVARSLARAVPTADWTVSVLDRTRVRLRGDVADVEPRVGGRWTGLVTGRVAANPAGLSDGGFRPYVVEPPPPPLHLHSCWFAVDLDGRVACFDR